jgi:hypothetical protein
MREGFSIKALLPESLDARRSYPQVGGRSGRVIEEAGKPGGK